MNRILRELVVAASLAALSAMTLGASCDKKSAARPDPDNTVGLRDGDDTPIPIVPENKVAAPEPGKPYPDPKLTADQQIAFDSLAEKLPSPCGKAHSLRASIASDPSCKRTPFASRYVKLWLAEEIPPDQIVELYAARYQQEETAQIDVAGTAFEGVPNAPVVLVEFFDYGCGHCKTAAPKLEDLAAEFPSDVVIYFKHFPLNLKSPSLAAAAASVAAQKQGKFKPFHRRLFESDHSVEGLRAIAREVGLDAARFDTDLNAPATRERVLADRTQGDKLGVDGTPAIFVNGRLYTDRIDLADFRDWVNEELAVNR